MMILQAAPIGMKMEQSLSPNWEATQQPSDVQSRHWASAINRALPLKSTERATQPMWRPMAVESTQHQHSPWTNFSMSEKLFCERRKQPIACFVSDAHDNLLSSYFESQGSVVWWVRSNFAKWSDVVPQLCIFNLTYNGPNALSYSLHFRVLHSIFTASFLPGHHFIISSSQKLYWC